MRRSTRIGLGLAALLLVLLVAYSAFWFVAAGRVEQGLAEWARSLRDQKLDLAWRSVDVSGFPFTFRIGLNEARLQIDSISPPAEITVPVLAAGTRPWSFRTWALTAPNGLSASLGPAGNAAASLKAAAAHGSGAPDAPGGTSIWLGLDQPTAELVVRLAARAADLWLTFPPHPPQSHTEPAFGLAFDLRELRLPAVPAPLPNPLDEVAVGLTLMGAMPTGQPRQAATAWRDAGGTLEVDRFALRWSALAITGSGTLALDADLQPMGGFSGAIEGYDQLMNALVAAGRMRAGDARLAQFALTMLAKSGPDGKPEIATSFTIQNGEMYLGPAKLGRAPHIAWE